MVCGFLTRIIVTYANMVSCDRSSISDNTPSAQSQCSPTTHILMQVRSFGKILQSRLSSVLYHSTSELLRTLLIMAASKPRSWLSGQLNILTH